MGHNFYWIQTLVNSKIFCNFAVQLAKTPTHSNAKIAQLVEHDLAKVGVAGSSPVFRSKADDDFPSSSFESAKLSGWRNW